MTMLETQGVCITLGGRKVLDNVGLRVGGGEMLGLLGPNGAGKTTLLKVLAGLTGPARVLLDGTDAGLLTPSQRARAVSYLPQGNDVHWPMPAIDVVALGRHPHGPGNARDRDAIARALAETDSHSVAHRPVNTLSGGERARVLLARALAVEAPVLLADEPVAHLDPGHQLQVLALLRRRAEAGDAVVVVLHDLALAARFCHRVLVLDQGRVVADGRPAATLDDALLAGVYGITVLRGEYSGVPYLLPWAAGRG